MGGHLNCSGGLGGNCSIWPLWIA